MDKNTFPVCESDNGLAGCGERHPRGQHCPPSAFADDEARVAEVRAARRAAFAADRDLAPGLRMTMVR